MDPADQDRQLRVLPPGGQQGHARDPDEPRRVRLVSGGVGASRPVGTGRRRHAQRHQQPRCEARARALRRLDGPGCRRRAAAGAAAATGRRAQRRDHAVGLGRSEGLPARRDHHRPPQPDRQRQRTGLRVARGERRLHARARSHAPPGEPHPGSGARSEHPVRRAADGAARVPILGRGADLDQQGQRAQPDARSQSAVVADVQGASQREPGHVPRGLDASVGEAHAGQRRRASPGDVRPGHEEDDAHRHLLRDAPPAVCRRREQHAVDEQRRRRRRRRLAEHEDVRRDRRRGEVAGLDGARARSQRKREA